MAGNEFSIVGHFEEIARSFPGRPAVLERDRVLTFEGLYEELRACSDLLSTHGAGPGQAIALLMSNSTTSIVGLLGTARTESAAILFPSTLPAAELRRYCRDTGIRIVLSPFTHRYLVEAAGGRLMARGPGNLEMFGFDVPRPTEEVYPGDFIGQLTSGADQPPKLAIRTHAAVWSEIQDFADEIGLNADDSSLVLPSIAHSYGLIGGTLAPLCREGCVILRQDFSPEEILELIRNERPTILYAVPFMYRAFAAISHGGTADMDSLRLCFSAGGPLPRDVDDEFARRYGRRICQDYGTTEVGVICVRLTWTPELRGSVGRPIPGRLVTITDAFPRLLAPGEKGEVIVQSPALARGYLNTSPRTDTAPGTTIEGGRLFTGDLGWMSEDGNLFLAGRKSLIIHVAGVTVDTSEIEGAIAVLPGVKEVVVLGVPHAEKGEVVKAVVVAEGLTAEDVVEHCRRHMEGVKVPEIVEFQPSLPRTPAGKILRRALRGRE